MTNGRVHYNNAIVDFQRKRGESSAAFFLPFLDETMMVLDIGCGPGTITAALSGASGRVIGIDIEPKAIEAAKEMAATSAHANLEFFEGDMTALPFGNETFDAVFFHAVLYHLGPATLEKALSEATRVLKPNGLIATRDADVGGNILHPESPGLRLSLDLWQKWYEHADPDAVRFGRRQGAILRSNGFLPIWSGASYVNHSADAETRLETVDDAKRSLRSLQQGLMDKGLAKEEQFEQAIAAWDDWGGDPDAVYLRCRCECVARKR
jgi:ubiquinone/menaquinone biosynthesis C-methylase UbiE